MADGSSHARFTRSAPSGNAVQALGLTFPIVVQRQWEVSLLYAKFATPIAYLIDERGILLSDVAVGVEPILALAEAPAREPYAHAESPTSRKAKALAT